MRRKFVVILGGLLLLSLGMFIGHLKAEKSDFTMIVMQLEEKKATPDHKVCREVYIPLSYGQLRAVEQDWLYFEAKDGTIRKVKQSGVSSIEKEVIVIERK